MPQALASTPLLIVSDYPLKAFVYTKLCREALSIEQIRVVSEVSSGHNDSCMIVIVDLNIMHEQEAALRAQVRQSYPKADLIVMEEDHEQVEFESHDQRTLVRMGKRVANQTLTQVLCTLQKKASQATSDLKTTSGGACSTCSKPKGDAQYA